MKINSLVKVTLPCDGKTSVQYEIGRVIYIGRRALVQFNSFICGHDGNGIGRVGRCWMCDFEKLEEV